VLLVREPSLLLVSMVGVGIAWASILAMPYAMLSNALPPAKMGFYMGVFNFFIICYRSWPQSAWAGVMERSRQRRHEGAPPRRRVDALGGAPHPSRAEGRDRVAIRLSSARPRTSPRAATRSCSEGIVFRSTGARRRGTRLPCRTCSRRGGRCTPSDRAVPAPSRSGGTGCAFAGAHGDQSGRVPRLVSPKRGALAPSSMVASAGRCSPTTRRRPPCSILPALATLVFFFPRRPAAPPAEV
jgi:hypothetical protein